MNEIKEKDTFNFNVYTNVLDPMDINCIMALIRFYRCSRCRMNTRACLVQRPSKEVEVKDEICITSCMQQNIDILN